MQNRWSKLAAAAAVILAVGVALNVIPMWPRQGVAWAQLVEKVQQARSCIHRMQMTVTREGQPDANVEFVMYRSSEFGIRRDAYAKGELIAQLYLPWETDRCVEILPGQKKYVKARFDETQLAEIRERNDPRELIKMLMEYEHADIGAQTIEGKQCEGIEVADPNFGTMLFGRGKGRLWADIETQLPVRIEFEGTSASGAIHTRLVMDEFAWDPPLAAADFEPNIPDDYTVMAEVDLSANEETVIRGLRTFARLTDGKYPSGLDLMTSMREVQFAFMAERRKRGVSVEQEPTKEEMDGILAIQAVCMFYGNLKGEGKDAAWYGDKVTAEFPHAVLMRWKAGDDAYRVVFGDLSVREAAAEELADLEAMPLNPNDGAINPEPVDGAVGVSLDGPQLQWLSGAEAVEHRVYFGTDSSNLVLLGTMAEPNFADLPRLERSTAYLWRVDEVNADGSVTTGELWSFSTGTLVGWWKLDETEGALATDATGHGHAGALVGDPLWAAGAVDGALELDGEGDYVDLGTGPDFDLTDQITIAAWVKVNAFDMDWQAIVTKGDTAWRLSRSMDDNLHFACTGMWPEWVHGSANVNDAQWHHVAGVYDGAELSLYVDGTLDTSAATSGPINVNEYPVYIGENAEHPQREWNGLIDDVRLYNYALSQTEIQTLHDAGP